MQQLPQDMQKTLRELNRSMQGFQPGSAAYNKMVADMQRLDQVLRELQPVLKTLNDKSNALVFEAKDKKILSRRGRKNEKMAIDGWRSAVDGVQFRGEIKATISCLWLHSGAQSAARETACCGLSRSQCRIIWRETAWSIRPATCSM
jgi:paraquat-inducible protein B